MDSFVSLPYNIVCNLKYRMCWHGWRTVYFPAQLWSYPRCIVALIRSGELCSEENGRLRAAIVCRLHATCSRGCAFAATRVYPIQPSDRPQHTLLYKNYEDSLVWILSLLFVVNLSDNDCVHYFTRNLETVLFDSLSSCLLWICQTVLAMGLATYNRKCCLKWCLYCFFLLFTFSAPFSLLTDSSIH